MPAPTILRSVGRRRDQERDALGRSVLLDEAVQAPAGLSDADLRAHRALAAEVVFCGAVRRGEAELPASPAPTNKEDRDRRATADAILRAGAARRAGQLLDAHELPGAIDAGDQRRAAAQAIILAGKKRRGEEI